MKFLDYHWDLYIRESFLIMYYSKGGVSQAYLGTLDFKKFEKYLEEASRIQKILSDGGTNG